MNGVTIKMVAEKAGVSKTTVSKYLNGGNVLSPFKENIEKSIKALTYSPNPIAQALKTNKSCTVGVVMPYINDVFSSEIVNEIENELQKKDYGLLICGYEGKIDIFKKKLDFMLKKRVDCLVVFPSGLDKSAFEMVNYIRDIPIIQMDMGIDGIESDIIKLDNYQAGFAATEYLIKKGHKNIAFLAGHQKSYMSSTRLEGCNAALKKYDIDKNSCLIKHGYASDDDIECLLNSDKKYTVVFAMNFYITIELLKQFNKRDIRVTEDISLLAFDDSPLYDLYRTPLSAVTQPLKSMGKQAAEIMIKRLNSNFSDFPITISLSPKIIERMSVKDINY